MCPPKKQEPKEKEKNKSFLFSLFQKSQKNKSNAPDDPPPPAEEEASAPLPPLSPSPAEQEEEEHSHLQQMPSLAGDSPFVRLFQEWNNPGGLAIEQPMALSLFVENPQACPPDILEIFSPIEKQAANLLNAMQIQDGNGNPLPLPAQAAACLSDDLLTAWILVFPPFFGGEDVQRETLEKELQKMHISYGINQEALQEIVEKKKYMSLIRIAQGKAPQDGEDGKIIDVIPRTVGNQYVQVVDGQVDFKDLNWLVHIQAGDKICEIVPPTQGTDGISVQGTPLRGADGKRPPIPMGKNTELSPDGTALLAKTEGQISFSQDKYHIDQMIHVPGSIDLSTGNLKVVGSVVVQGDVCDGFSVEATGDITVQGYVGMATLRAGNNIFIRRGMNGGVQGQLIAGKDIKCIYLENGTVKAGGNIYMESVINSNVTCDSQIFITSGKGTIIGGQISALETIEAKKVGNMANHLTVLSVGFTPEFVEEKKRIQKEYEEAAQELDQIQGGIERLSAAMQMNPEIGDALSGMKLKLSVAQMKEGKVKKVWETWQEKERKIKNCRIVVGELNPVVQLNIDGISKMVNKVHYECNIYKRDGEIYIGSK